MVFRTVSAIAVLLICFGTSGGEALAQYYPPARAYPPPQTYPPQGYYPRQGYRPLPPVADDDDDMVYDLEDRLLPPGATVEQQANKPPSPNGPGLPSAVTQLRHCAALRTNRPPDSPVSYQRSCHWPSINRPMGRLR